MSNAKEMILKVLPKDNGLNNCKYYKLNDTMACELGINSFYIHGEKPVRVTVVENDKVNNTLTKTFYDECEFGGGRIVDKSYKDALDLATEYVKELKKQYSKKK